MSNVHSKLAVGARFVLGLIFFVFGLNGFFAFLPQPPLPETAGAFLGGLAASGYFFPLLKGTEVLVGIALLSNRFVPLALTVLAPISLNIFLFHALLAPALALPIAILTLQAYLAWNYRAAYRALLQARASVALPATNSPARSGSLTHAREAV